jgi:hypothetical protein
MSYLNGLAESVPKLASTETFVKLTVGKRNSTEGLIGIGFSIND